MLCNALQIFIYFRYKSNNQKGKRKILHFVKKLGIFFKNADMLCVLFLKASPLLPPRSCSTREYTTREYCMTVFSRSSQLCQSCHSWIAAVNCWWQTTGISLFSCYSYMLKYSWSGNFCFMGGTTKILDL